MNVAAGPHEAKSRKVVWVSEQKPESSLRRGDKPAAVKADVRTEKLLFALTLTHRKTQKM